MPALSNGNTCWGNRKAFNMCSEYISDSFLLGPEMRDDVVTVRSNFISTNQYYGFHRIPETQITEKMVVDECHSTSYDQINTGCRKRPNTAQQNDDIAKRICHQEPEQQSISTETIRRNHSYDSGFCLF